MFPGGDYDAYRPTAEANTIDFNGRTGYVRTALAAGVPIVPPNLPLPTKVVTEVLPPIDITARFGADPDVGVVDSHIREVMQTALNRLASHRRFPILG